MNLQKSSNHAISILIVIAKNQYISVGKVASELGLSPQYIAKLTQPLVRSGLLNSVRGCNGGLTLGRPCELIDLYSVISAVEGRGNPIDKDLDENMIRLSTWLQTRVRNELKEITIADVMEGRVGEQYKIS